jgi:hypothetical protein
VRVRQHLVLRDSSVTTGAAVAGLRVEHVRGVAWWEHPLFMRAGNVGEANRAVLLAAERVAEDVLEPTLRSRGRWSHEAASLYEDEAFRAEMLALFRDAEPAGRLELPTLAGLVDQLKALEERVVKLERGLKSPPSST